VYEVEVLLDSGSDVLRERGLNASGWETREGEEGSEKSCAEERA
jgi:hypothetical protein